MTSFFGRKEPYTVSEIKRKTCFCGKRAIFQWQCCANGNRWVPLCREHDIQLNEIAMAIMQIPGRRELLTKYRRQAKRG
jgi:hypothetical protein